MRIQRATRQYEAWLAEQIPLVAAGLEVKHQQMAAGIFLFLRATYYRWAQIWPAVCPTLQKTPAVLAVGDLHVENFGTWRDAEGRLVWGVNDFDEVITLPYTNDLVRLATSALLAIHEGRLKLGGGVACDAILTGYHDGLVAGGRPIVLAAEHHWLRTAAMTEARDPKVFWEKFAALPKVEPAAWADAKAALEALLPQPTPAYHVTHRLAGLGSLGRQRWVALAEWQGGMIAREAKALVPSAVYWATKEKPGKIGYRTILNRAVRAVDPLVRPQGRWIIRRLAPDCSRVELAALAADRDEQRLLSAMGWETANIHLGTPDATKSILRDLEQRPTDWLHEAAKTMQHALTEDYGEWQMGQIEAHDKQANR